MDDGKDDHTEEYNQTIFAFNVVLTAAVTSLGIFGNTLVLLLLRNWDSKGKSITYYSFSILIIKCQTTKF